MDEMKRRWRRCTPPTRRPGWRPARSGAPTDVAIQVSEAPDAGVIIDGDVDDLDVTCSADGVLTIREGRTASSSFFSRRGFASADVELYLPCPFHMEIAAHGAGQEAPDRAVQLNVAAGGFDQDIVQMEAPVPAVPGSCWISAPPAATWSCTATSWS